MTISAVIPVYNTSPSELSDCLASLRAARIADEVILVDDRSDREDTRRALQQHAETGARVLCSHAPHGMSSARALGVHAANSDFCLSVDADDTIELRGTWQPDSLPPIVLATSNVSSDPPQDIWTYIERKTPIQWGSLVKTDIARSIAGSFMDDREEHRRWAYCLLMEAWRSRIPVGLSGLHYTWRGGEGRDTVTTRMPQTKGERFKRWRRHLDEAIKHIGLCDHDAAAVRLWADRKALKQPYVERHSKAGARCDTHVLSYSGCSAWLRQSLDSMSEDPTNVHILVGGHFNSIGKARAAAFELASSEYVSFTDDDDYLVPGVMQQCIDYLDAHPDCVGVYTDTAHINPDGSDYDVEHKGPWRPLRQIQYMAEITHQKVMRRSAVEPYLEELARWPTYEEYVLCGLMANHGRWHHLPVVGAVKRRNSTDRSSMRLASRDLWRRAVATVTAPLMRHG